MPFDFLCCVRPGVEDIVELDYSNQSLADVPTEVFVYERTLEILYCQSNRITELPRQLFMCHGLKYLDLSDNELQAIPTAISYLDNLLHFNISRNSLTSIPETMKALKYLLFLDLSVNPLEKLPDAITNLIALQELYLNDTYLEYLPGNFGRLGSLKILELRDNYLMILPKSLSRSMELLRLDIGQNEIQHFPEVIGKFIKLKELWMDNNSLVCIPSVVQFLHNLVHFEASNNTIEELAPEIGFCSQLVDLSLSVNKITELPDTIGQLSNLTTLKLDSNRLLCLPDSIGQMTNLEELMLMSNYIDKLPSSIGLLRKLKYLNVDENLLRAVPPEIGSCIELTVLSLRANRLTKVPPEIGHLSSLRVLNLVKNSLNHLPQSLLNCDKLVALWLSENQSKPLVPMHSEVDPQTYEQVLTCFLFPQVPSTPVDNKSDTEKSINEESQPCVPKHISFVDMKSIAKVPEKPGQLRRAPTPYPKELRALAKHARNIQKDNTHDISPAMQNAVHIKAAKITPTLQQRFASDNKINIDLNSKESLVDTKKEMKSSEFDKSLDNAYDRPLDLANELDKTYKSVDHALYPENNETKTKSDFVTDTDDNFTLNQRYNMNPNDKYMSKQDIGRSSATSQSHLYAGHVGKGYNAVSESYYNKQGGPLNRMQRLSLSSHDRHPADETVLPSHFDESHYGLRQVMENVHTFEPIYSRNEQITCHSLVPVPDGSDYPENIYNPGAYPNNSEKMYGHRNFDTYNYSSHGSCDLTSSRVHTVSQVVSSITMPNLSNYNNLYSETEGRQYSPSVRQASSPNANFYNASTSSPTYVSSQSPELYSPTGHTNTTNPYRMTDTPLVSDDGSYSHLHSPTSQNMFELLEGIPPAPKPPCVVSHRHSPSGLSEPVYNRGQPPPYHIAAPYTKHAQYFNGSGG